MVVRLRLVTLISLFLIISIPAYSATEIRSSGVKKGYANIIDFTNNMTADVSGITATVSSTGGGSGEVNTASNSGDGVGVFKTKLGVDLQLKSLVSGDNVSITQDTNSISIRVPYIGEVNTASNLGSGNQWFKLKSVSDLQFRTVTSGDNVIMVTNPNDVQVRVPSIPTEDLTGVFETTYLNLPQGSNGQILSYDSAQPRRIFWANPGSGGSGEINTASNVGTGNELFKTKSGVDLQFRTITSSDNVTLTTNLNDVSIGVVSIPSNDVVGVIGSNNGGTGLTSYSKGDLISVNASNNLQKLSVGTNGFVLSADSSTATGLVWSALPAGGSGTVTNNGTLTSNAVIIGNGTTIIQAITADTATSGHFLSSTSTSPAFRQIMATDISGDRVYINFPLTDAVVSSDVGGARLAQNMTVGNLRYAMRRILFADVSGVNGSNNDRNCAMWAFQVPPNCNPNGLTAKVHYAMMSSDSDLPANGTVTWSVSLWAVTSQDLVSMITESFGSPNVQTQIGPTMVSGDRLCNIPISSASNDGLTAGDWCYIKLRRSIDTMTGDAAVFSFALTQ